MLKGLEAVVDLDKLKVSMTLRDIYEGLKFRPKPRLVEVGSENDEPTGDVSSP